MHTCSVYCVVWNMEAGLNFSREQGVRRNSYYYHANNGYYYHKYHTQNGTCYYRCTIRTCPARVILKQGICTERYGHVHRPDFIQAEIRRERLRFVSEATSLNVASIDDIFNDAGYAGRRFSDILTRRRLRPAMNTARMNAYPAEPQTLVDLDTVLKCERYKSMCAVSQFQDSVYGGSRIGEDSSYTVLFISKRCAELMKSVSFVYGFSSSLTSHSMPHQTMHTIGTVLSNIEIPLVWLFLEQGSLEAYVAGFTLLRSHLVTWLFRRVICKDDGWDAEAYRRVFSAVVEPSLDHFMLDIGQTANSLLGRDVLQSNPYVGYIVHLCCALPILPQDILVDAFACIRKELMKLNFLLQSSLGVLLHYIENNWTRHPDRGGRFSVCGSAERTSNAMRRTLERMDREIFSTSNKGYYSCIRKMLKLEETSFRDVTSLRGNIRPAARRVASLAEDSEIIVLTKALTRVPGTMSASILNLLKATGEKQKLVVNSLLFGT